MAKVKIGAPKKPSGERAKLVTSSYRPAVVAMLLEYGEGSISRGARVVAEKEYARWLKRQPSKNPG